MIRSRITRSPHEQLGSSRECNRIEWNGVSIYREEEMDGPPHALPLPSLVL